MKPEPTAEQFLKDVSKHRLQIKLDASLYRDLVFKEPGNSNRWFGLVTWPGYLTIYGDMGTWTFARLDDMFDFFRDKNLKINPDYWSEKLRHGAHGGSDTAKVFDSDVFKEQLRERVGELLPGKRRTGPKSIKDKERLAEVLEDLEQTVLCRDSEFELLAAAREFSSFNAYSGDKFEFDPSDLPDGRVFSYHFLWCLYAIVWGINEYLKEHAAK